MPHPYKKSDKILFAAALFTISGAVLAYNIRTAGGGEVSVSLAEITAYRPAEISVISDAAAANLTADDAVFTAAEPAAAPHDAPLLDPIVRP